MNNKQIIGSLSLITVMLAAISCNKTSKCVSLEAAVIKADSVFYSAQSNTNCVAYKAAMQAWIDETDCSNEDATQKADYQQKISALSCQ